MGSSAPGFLISSSLLQTTSPYLLVNKEDTGGKKLVKQMSGILASSVLVVVGTVEAVISTLLAFLVKSCHFVFLKNSGLSLKMHAQIVQPLFARSFIAAGNVAIAASRVVTNFQGPESVAYVDRVIEKTCASFASSHLIKTIQNLHINGFTVEPPLTPPAKGEVEPSTPSLAKWNIERKHVLMGIGLLLVSIAIYKLSEPYWGGATIIPEPFSPLSDSGTSAATDTLGKNADVPVGEGLQIQIPSTPTKESIFTPPAIPGLSSSSMEQITSPPPSTLVSPTKSSSSKTTSSPVVSQVDVASVVACIGIPLVLGISLYFYKNRKSQQPLTASSSASPSPSAKSEAPIDGTKTVGSPQASLPANQQQNQGNAEIATSPSAPTSPSSNRQGRKKGKTPARQSSSSSAIGDPIASSSQLTPAPTFPKQPQESDAPSTTSSSPDFSLHLFSSSSPSRTDQALPVNGSFVTSSSSPPPVTLNTSLTLPESPTQNSPKGRPASIAQQSLEGKQAPIKQVKTYAILLQELEPIKEKDQLPKLVKDMMVVLIQNSSDNVEKVKSGLISICEKYKKKKRSENRFNNLLGDPKPSKFQKDLNKLDETNMEQHMNTLTEKITAYCSAHTIAESRALLKDMLEGLRLNNMSEGLYPR